METRRSHAHTLSDSHLLDQTTHRLTHLARALDEWVREGTIEPKGLCQVQLHLRHIVMACDGTLPSSFSCKNTAATGGGKQQRKGANGAGGGGGCSKPSAPKKPPPPPKGTKGKGGAGAAGKVPTVERAVAEGMAFLGKLDAHKWFARPVVEVWPDFKVCVLH